MARSILLLSDRALSAASCCWLDGLVGLLFRLTCHITDVVDFMRTFAVAVEGGKCLMSSIVRLVKVVKWPFLTSWSKVLFTRLKRDEWYHLARSLLLLADRALSAASCCWLDGLLGLLFRLTCHMTDVVDLMPFSTVSPSLTALR